MRAAVGAGACLGAIPVFAAIYCATHRIPFVGRQRRGTTDYTDHNGTFAATGTFRMPDDTRYKPAWQSHIDAYAHRPVEARPPGAALVRSGLDGNKAFLLVHKGPELVVMEHVELTLPSRADPNGGNAVRTLFRERRIHETTVSAHQNNGVSNAMEDLEYPIGHHTGYVALRR